MKLRHLFVPLCMVAVLLSCGEAPAPTPTVEVLPTSTSTPEPTATPQPTQAPVAQAVSPTPTPVSPTSTPAPVEIYTPTIEADVYRASGPSHIVFKVPMSEYNFTDRHVIGLDDAATSDVRVTINESGGEYIVDISSPDALETPKEDVGVFVGDVEADFCGDPQPVLTVNEPLDGAKWKPTRWHCTPSGGGGDYDIHVFPILNE